MESAGRDEQKKRIADMGTYLREQPTTLTEYDRTPSGGCDALSRWKTDLVPLLKRSPVSKGSLTIALNKFTVEFKSGVTVDVDE